jgi:nicotinate-nucleotide adenylyltransferase
VRIAVLGGTFDPVHNGHLTAALSVAAAFQTDEIHFVPAYSAPHKQGRRSTSAFHRFAMVALAVSPFQAFRTSTIEVDALGKRYTVETLEQMQQEYPGADLVFVLGTDMYQDFETWRDYRRIFSLAHLAVVNRPGFSFREDLASSRTLREGETVTLPEEPGVFFLPFVVQPVSSTQIREDLLKGIDVHQWLPPEVRGYIERNQLYC